MTIPPYIVSTTILYCIAYASDKLQTRGKFVVATSALAGTGYVYVALTEQQDVLGHSPALSQPTPCSPGEQSRSLLCDVLHHKWDIRNDLHDACVVYAPLSTSTAASLGLTTSTVTQNLASETKRATAMPLFQAIGQCGSILGSHIYPLTEGPRYL